MQIEFNNEARLSISRDILNQFNTFEQRRGEFESGGILLGKYDLQSRTYYISQITTPNKSDGAGFSFFIRNKKAAQKQINKAWKKSKGIVNYLGEWHTHCCKYPTPSYTDLNFIKQLVDDKTSPYKHFFMIIVGQDKNLCAIVSKSNSAEDIIKISKNYEEELK